MQITIDAVDIRCPLCGDLHTQEDVDAVGGGNRIVLSYYCHNCNIIYEARYHLLEVVS
jgi:transposase-like protein